MVDKKSNAEKFLENAYQKNDWDATGGLIFLNPELYRWVLNFENSKNDQKNYANLNTVFRWQINRMLAKQIFESHEENFTSATYIPALGRARSICLFEEEKFERKRKLLTRQLTEITKTQMDTMELEYFASVLSCPVAEIPHLGLEVLVRLPENPNRSQLLEGIAKAREDEYVATVRAWLINPETDDYEIKKICDYVGKQLGQAISKPLVSNVSFSPVLALPPQVSLEFEGRIVDDYMKGGITQGLRRLKRDVFSHWLKGKESTALLSLSNLSDTKYEISFILDRVEAILNPEKE